MPVYLGHTVPELRQGKKPEVSPELRSKGIELLRASPSDVSIVCLPLAQASFWGIFISYLSSIVYCLSAKVDGLSLFYEEQEVVDKHPKPFPLSLPPLCVTLRNPSQQAIEFLLNAGFEQVDLRGKPSFLHNNVSTDLIRTIINPQTPIELDEKCYTPFRYCNLSSIYSALDLITLFSYVIQSMGFTTSTDSTLTSDDFETVDTLDTPAEEENMNVDQENTNQTRSEEETHPVFSLFKKTGSFPASAMNKIPKGGLCVKELSSRKSYFSSNDTNGNYQGNVIRYVSELAVEDNRTVIHFIQRHLIRNLGSTPTDCFAAFSDLKSSWGNLRSTDFGLELSHLVRCIEISLELQTLCSPIFDNGFYEGSVIMGSGYKLFIHGKIVSPLSQNGLAVEIQAMATHQNTLNEIVAIVRREVVDFREDATSIKTMRYLRALVSSYPLSESAKDEIQLKAATLRFVNRPWSVNQTSLLKMIGIIRDLSSITDDTPIGSRGLFSTDSVVVALSCFGEGSCPSFLHPNGTKIDLTGNLPRPSANERGNRQTDRGKQQTSNAAWTFAVRRVSFDEALGNTREMIRDKVGRSVSTSVAKGLGCVVFAGTSFATIFSSLSEMVKVLDGSSRLTAHTEYALVDEEANNNDNFVGRSAKRVKRVKI